MKKSLFALALGTFGLGMAEFVMMGILPDVANSLGISIPQAGHFISAYALGVCFGALGIVLLMRKEPLKKILIIIMSIHLFGNLITAMSVNYHMMLLMRFISGLPHGVFFGVGAIVAKKVADNGKQAAAVSMMVSGMTVANLVGIPLGTSISHHFSWRVTFLLIALFAVCILSSIIKWIPEFDPMPDNGFRGQFKFLTHLTPWLLIIAIMFGNGGIFCWLSYINPILTNVAGFKAQYVSYLMLIAGLGMCVGNLTGGKLADKIVPPKVASGMQFFAALILVGIFFFSTNQILSIVMTFLCAFCLFGVSAPQQTLIIDCSKGGELFGAALAQVAFNLGNAIGAYVGGLPVVYGYGFEYCTIPGIVFAILGGILLAIMAKRCDKKRNLDWYNNN